MKRPGTPTYPKTVGPWDLEPHYSRHVGAMTSEGLHEKQDIAFQLALRDKEIERLRGMLLEATAKAEPQGAPRSGYCVDCPLPLHEGPCAKGAPRKPECLSCGKTDGCRCIRPVYLVPLHTQAKGAPQKPEQET